jgi:hypothetical protein
MHEKACFPCVQQCCQAPVEIATAMNIKRVEFPSTEEPDQDPAKRVAESTVQDRQRSKKKKKQKNRTHVNVIRSAEENEGTPATANSSIRLNWKSVRGTLSLVSSHMLETEKVGGGEKGRQSERKQESEREERESARERKERERVRERVRERGKRERERERVFLFTQTDRQANLSLNSAPVVSFSFPSVLRH